MLVIACVIVLCLQMLTQPDEPEHEACLTDLMAMSLKSDAAVCTDASELDFASAVRAE